MTRACRALVEVGFTRLDLNRIVIRAACGNDKSAAVPLRLGFTLEGTSRQAERLYDRYVDLRVYALLKEEWRGARNGGPTQD